MLVIGRPGLPYGLEDCQQWSKVIMAKAVDESASEAEHPLSMATGYDGAIGDKWRVDLGGTGTRKW
jgi:hypothetical protein